MFSARWVGAWVTVLTAFAAGCSKPVPAPAHESIFGEWELVDLEMAVGQGMGGEVEVSGRMWLTFVEGVDRAIWKFEVGKKVETFETYCSIDGQKVPGEIVLQAPDGSDAARLRLFVSPVGAKRGERMGIFRVEGELLTLNLGRSKPADFDAVGELKMTLRRVK